MAFWRVPRAQVARSHLVRSMLSVDQPSPTPHVQSPKLPFTLAHASRPGCVMAPARHSGRITVEDKVALLNRCVAGEAGVVYGLAGGFAIVKVSKPPFVESLTMKNPVLRWPGHEGIGDGQRPSRFPPTGRSSQASPAMMVPSGYGSVPSRAAFIATSKWRCMRQIPLLVMTKAPRFSESRFLRGTVTGG